MKEFKYTVKDKMGIHARPAALLVKKASSFPCDVTITKEGMEADAKKIFELMGLVVRCGQEIMLRAEGDREEEAMLELRKLLEENL